MVCKSDGFERVQKSVQSPAQLYSSMSAVDGLSGARHMEAHDKASAPSRFYSSTSGRRVAPLAMLTKTPGIFIIH